MELIKILVLLLLLLFLYFLIQHEDAGVKSKYCKGTNMILIFICKICREFNHQQRNSRTKILRLVCTKCKELYCFHSNVRSPGCNICQRLGANDLMLIAKGGRSVKEMGQMPYLQVYLPICPSLSAGLWFCILYSLRPKFIGYWALFMDQYFIWKIWWQHWVMWLV